jgi:hypothetical protein
MNLLLEADTEFEIGYLCLTSQPLYTISTPDISCLLSDIY